MQPGNEGASEVLRKFRRFVGFAVLIFSVFCICAAVGDLVTGGDGKTEPGVLLGLLLFFLGTAYGGWRLFRGARPPKPGAAGTPERERERVILAFAQAENGRVTVAEVATSCGLSVADAKATLDALCKQGVAELAMTDAGVLVYCFPGFMSDEEKARAV